MGQFDTVPGLDGYQRQVQLNQAQTDSNFANFGNAAKMMEYTRSLGQQEQQRQMAQQLLPQMSERAQMIYKMTGDPVKAMEAHQQDGMINKLQSLLGGGASSQPGMSASSAALGGFPPSAVTPDAPRGVDPKNALAVALLGAQAGLTGVKGADSLEKVAGFMQNAQKPDATIDSAVELKRREQALTLPYQAPVTMETSSGQKASIFPSEFPAVQKGQAPARFSSTPSTFPRESPQALKSAGTDQLAILQQEREKQLATGKVDPQLDAEISKAQQRSAGQYPKGQPQGVGTIGLSQPQADKITQDRQTAAGKSTDEAFAKDYVQFATGGGADAAKQLAQLKDVSDALTTRKDLTGPNLAMLPENLKARFYPDAVAMQERVAEVVQRSLRAILGAQFTENEGVRLIARAYNPALPESENKTRVDRLMTQLSQALEAKQSAASYFEKNGTLEGWTGKLWSAGDFDPSPGKSASGSIGTKKPAPKWSDL